MKKTFDKSRPLSWSAISTWEWNREDWYEKYVLGIRPPANKEMLFGKQVAESIENGTCTVPGLLKALQKKKEHKFEVMFGKIPLVGFADAFDEMKFRKLDEVKTGKKPWDQKRADTHGQIDIYLLMNLITNKIKPEEVDCTIYWIPTEENGDFSISFRIPVTVYKFKTKRTMSDILNFGAKINRIYKEMQEYVENHD